MTRLLAALSIAFTIFTVPAASAAQLVYVEWSDCGICKVFNRQMAWAYSSSTVGKKVPLRRVDILRHWPADLKRVSRPEYTPVFILVDKGRKSVASPVIRARKGSRENLQRLLNRR